MKYLYTIIALFASLTVFAQSRIYLTVRWNSANSRYEVYAKPSFSNSNFIAGSQITLVVDSETPNVAFNVTPVAFGGWIDGDRIYAPSITPNLDFHAIQLGIVGGLPSSFNSGQETLLFTFILPNRTCINGLRLYNNGIDPNSLAAGMQGGDYSNTFVNVLNSQELYNANYNNTPLSCTDCSTIVAPELIK